MNDPLTPPSLSLISYKKVPNVFPTTSPDSYRLAVIGEAPGEREEQYGIPFIGPSGDLLNSLLASSGIDHTAVFIGNVCPYRPPGNDILEWGYEHELVKEGWAELQQQLKDYAPHAILALGNTPLHFLTGRTGISSWRGSILSTPFGKVIPALHPAAVLRDYLSWPLLRFDIGRACEEAKTPSLSLPQRTLELELSAYEICNRLDQWPAGRLLSFDIEGGLDAFPCCSVSDSPFCGFIIAWSRYSDSEQARVAVSLSRVLYRCDVPKVLQNSLYDRFVLAYGYNMLIRGVTEDTMDKQSSIYAELKKSLGMICSIWTREPYYKHEGKAGNRGELLSAKESQEQYYRYCIKDSCVTLEACLAMNDSLSPEEEAYYRFSVSLKSPLFYMQAKGFRFAHEVRDAELARLNENLASSILSIEEQVKPMQFTKTEFTNRIRGEGGSIGDARLKRVLYEQKGYPPQKKGRGPKAKITCDVVALLNLAEGRKKSLGTPDLFIQSLLLHKKLETTKEVLEWQTDPKDGRMKCCYNQFSKGEDDAEEGGGATDTGRLRCSKSIIPTGLYKKGKPILVGGNLQTVTKKLRRLYLADPDYWLFQCDLAGADGWTVAARCLKHGDSTMWDDYKFGLKPALVIVLMWLGKITPRSSREEIFLLSQEYKQWEKEHESESWLYFACKRVQHGSNYGMQEKTMAMQVLKDSYNVTGKPVFIEPQVCAALQRLYLSRYPGIYSWHQWARREVSEGRNLKSASGHTRVFFGCRKSWDAKRKCYDADHETWKKFLADEPQENTTYATNLAMHRLWHDPDNRRSSVVVGRSNTPTTPSDVSTRSSLVVQPLHTVHDALIGQFPKHRAEWACGKIREWFNNTLSIAGIDVVIPFEGAYGPSWGELGTKYGGGEI